MGLCIWACPLVLCFIRKKLALTGQMAPEAWKSCGTEPVHRSMSELLSCRQLSGSSQMPADPPNVGTSQQRCLAYCCWFQKHKKCLLYATTVFITRHSCDKSWMSHLDPLTMHILALLIDILQSQKNVSQSWPCSQHCGKIHRKNEAQSIASRNS